VWSNDPVCYAGRSVATDRASHAGHVRSVDPEYKRYPGPPGWDFGVGPRKMYQCHEISKEEVRVPPGLY
jgi:hypothetical protein